ncbi:MAG: amidohydrolase, partial [Gemmatimonadota bacterium]|nr:amidohydrolase [Gemmatimonadota bacterium]
MTRRLFPALLLPLLGCAGAAQPGQPSPAASAGGGQSWSRAQYPSTYQRRAEAPVLIRNATILTAAGPELSGASLLIQDGKIVAVGGDLAPPAGARIVDGTGKFVTPGLIDTHSHLGVYAAPGTFAEGDGNEATSPVTAQVWAEHSFWPQDPQIPLAIAGGVTIIQALPGSANLIGGRSATLRLVPSRTVQEMKLPGAPYGLKMACGENPKRVYQSRGPSTRMGNMAGYREAFIRAERYRERWDEWLAHRRGAAPDRDLQLETL